MKRGLKWPGKDAVPKKLSPNSKMVEVLLIQLMLEANTLLKIVISEVTFYRWRKEYHGMASFQLKRLNEVEKGESTTAQSDFRLDIWMSSTGRVLIKIVCDVSTPLLPVAFLMKWWSKKIEYLNLTL